MCGVDLFHSKFGKMFLEIGNMFLVNGMPFINKSHISCEFLEYSMHF